MYGTRDICTGESLLTATKEGYRESKQRVTISRTSSLDISIPAPTPIYGKLMVNASQLDIEVTIDGKQLGTAPNIFSDILVGSHTVTYSGKGYTTKSEKITIEEGETAQATVTLAEAAPMVTPAPVVTTPTSVPKTQRLPSAPYGMVYVEGGTFKMGNRNVILSPFYIGKYEVTQAEWEAMVGSNPSKFKGWNRPVENVSFIDCVKFCNAKSRKEGKEECYKIEGDIVTVLYYNNGYRLPTEEKWEYAARGGKQSKGYTYAGSNKLDDVAWYTGNTRLWIDIFDIWGHTRDVGTKSPNELGIYDMSGNVEELCERFRSHPSRIEGSRMGGCYFSSADHCWCTHRDITSHTRWCGCSGRQGFRVVLGL